MAASTDSAKEYRFYIGTYTRKGSEGIYTGVLDARRGSLRLEGRPASVKNPSFLCMSPCGQHLYSVSEVADMGGRPTGAVSALSLDPTGDGPVLLNSSPSGGKGPCYVSVDRTGRTVLVANYRGGSVAALPVRPDGSLGEAASVIQHEGSGVHPGRQEGPHAHSITVSPNNRFAYAADLGIDKLVAYRLDPEQSLLQAIPSATPTVTPGSGPRHTAFHPSLSCAYLVNELSNTVTVFDWDAESGGLREKQTVNTLPAGYDGETTAADIHCTPDGKYLYASNRGHDSLAVFRISDDDGTLTPRGHVPCGGKTPRNFAVDPSGRWLLCANQDSDNIVLFRITVETGMLEPVGSELTVSMPVCIHFCR